MKSTLAALLITASFAAFAQNPPAITPEARDRFLNGVHDFAGGKTVPGAPQDDLRMGTPGNAGGGSPAAGSSSAPASWRAQDGKATNGSIVGSSIAAPKIAPQQIQSQPVVSPWGQH